MAIVYNAEALNKLGRQHWQSFAGQNYFDPTGVFMSAVVSGPLLVVMFIVLVRGRKGEKGRGGRLGQLRRCHVWGAPAPGLGQFLCWCPAPNPTCCVHPCVAVPQINYLVSCAGMLVQAKRKELIHKAKRRQREEAGAAGAAAAGGSGPAEAKKDK